MTDQIKTINASQGTLAQWHIETEGDSAPQQTARKTLDTNNFPEVEIIEYSADLGYTAPVGTIYATLMWFGNNSYSLTVHPAGDGGRQW